MKEQQKLIKSMTDAKNMEMMNRVTAAGNNESRKLAEYAKTGQLSTLYTDILLSSQSQKGFSQFFNILLNNTEGAVLWHCSYGKDRTGLAAALLCWFHFSPVYTPWLEVGAQGVVLYH